MDRQQLFPDAAQRGQPRIAVIGAGISGLACAWLLSRQYAVTLFEAADYLGGHTHTVDIALDGQEAAVDTGFLVFNERTYPNLCALFSLLGVESTASEMSFAVSLQNPALEWSGTNLATLFGQKRNLLRPDFWRMLRDILRFNRESQDWLQANGDSTCSLRDFLQQHGYCAAFADWYLLPMAAAIWSCPTGQMLDYPLATFVRFCSNHGLLQISDRPLWRTVLGGGRQYVQKIVALLPDIRLNTAVRSVQPLNGRRGIGVLSTHKAQNSLEVFDQVVFACHSDQALQLLGDTATASQRRLLGAIAYQPNRAVLHTDTRLLPRRPALWSAWNYLASSPAADKPQAVCVSYLLNRLQPLPFALDRHAVMVTLNPITEPDERHVLAEFDYAHPVFDQAAIAAQGALATIQGEHSLWFCGAWGGYGFHEDGLKSALRVANALGVAAPWQDEAEVLAPSRLAV